EAGALEVLHSAPVLDELLANRVAEGRQTPACFPVDAETAAEPVAGGGEDAAVVVVRGVDRLEGRLIPAVERRQGAEPGHEHLVPGAGQVVVAFEDGALEVLPQQAVLIEDAADRVAEGRQPAVLLPEAQERIAHPESCLREVGGPRAEL